MRKAKTYKLDVVTTVTRTRATVTTKDIKGFLRLVKADCEKGRYVVMDDKVIDGELIRWVDVLGPVDDGKERKDG